MMSFKQAKRSLAAYKGHYTIHAKAFHSVLAVQPQPTEEAVRKSYEKVQKRLDLLFESLDGAITLLQDKASWGEEKIDEDNENAEMMAYYDKVLSEQTGIEALYANFFSSRLPKQEEVSSQNRFPTVLPRPNVRLTALDPPAWNGVKADFFTWQKKYIHIMQEAQISNELTQLCYLQKEKTLPAEYRMFITDCCTMQEVWSRLEERIPKETIKYEIIADFRKLKALPSKRTPTMLRDFANAISLFCRRMSDLDFHKENYSCIIMQDVYDRLNYETALRYRSKISLQKELGQDVEEDLNTLCSFLRSEATTLEMTNADMSSKLNLKFNALNVDNGVENENGTSRCLLGCTEQHRLIDCHNYMALPGDKRRDVIKNSSRCFICLGANHIARVCPKAKDDKKCTVCHEGNHHWSICLKQPKDQNTMNTSSSYSPSTENQLFQKHGTANSARMSEETSSSYTGVSPQEYAPLILAEVRNRCGDWIVARCLLDTGSNSTLVRTEFAKSNQMKGGSPCYVTFKVAGGGIHKEKAEEWQLEIRPLKSEQDPYLVCATGVRKPCADIGSLPKDICLQHEHLKEFNHKIFRSGGQVDILIGQDYAPLIVPECIVRAEVLPDETPSAAVTRLGCFLYGGLCYGRLSVKEVVSVNFLSIDDERELKEFFIGDILGVKPTTLCICSDNQIAESAFIKHVTDTTSITEDGRVSVKMPWKPGYPAKLPNNFLKAKEQLVRRENQLIRVGKLDAYNEEMRRLRERGFVRELTPSEVVDASTSSSWYLNHRMIERPDKTSSKLRIVWDSAAPFNGVCLNDALEKGPSYTNLLFRCLLKWRVERIAVVGDIEKMFNQIVMDEFDQKYHRFLWREGNQSIAVKILQWTRVLFGDKPSPDLACFALRFLAEKHKEECPIGSAIVNDETYVDDVTFSKSDSSMAKQAISEVETILQSGSFSVKTWDSNSPEVDENKEERTVDVLGHRWDKDTDYICIKPREIILPEDKLLTKRYVLGAVSKIWDPYGYLLPKTIKYRMDLQRIWQSGLDWDEPLSLEYVKEWTANIKEMQKLVGFNLERCYRPKEAISLPQLHAFSDGGNEAYGTCVFIRWRTKDGFIVRFVAAKAFVAPLKRKSIPRLELMGALAMSRLVSEVIESLGYTFEYTRFWIDSFTVLYWLSTSSARYRTFVSIRIQEFQDTHNNWLDEIRYVPSEVNPADCLTRPMTTEVLHEWHTGGFRSFLLKEETEWQKRLEFDTIAKQINESSLEEKPDLTSKMKIQPKIKKKVNSIQLGISCTTAEECDDFGFVVAEQYSSWSRLVSSVAFVKKSLKARSFNSNLINSPNDTLEATRTLFYICQHGMRKSMDQTKGRFIKYHPVLDVDGFIRATGRLDKTNIPDEVKHPILLPSNHPLMYLFALFMHKRYLHQGYRVVIANIINDGLVIGGAKRLLTTIASKCLFCRTRRRKLLIQRMGELPAFRVEINNPPFTTVAVDFFGPLKVKLSRNVTTNASVLIITCATTRCIHLELSINIDTNSFIRAWRRFTTLRGVHPVQVFSDGGTTFKSANSSILEWIKLWDMYLIQKEFPRTQFDFKWKFNVPYASHMNGIVESLIHSVRKGLDAAILNYTTCRMTFEEWQTVLYEVTYVINSRPLIPDGDPFEFKCITGNAILHPYGQPQLPQFSPQEHHDHRNMLKRVQTQVDVFWNTWTRHIPPQLNLRNKWYHSRDNLEKGDFVIVFEKGLKTTAAPRSLWKKAIVVDVHPGQDGLVRSVTIRDSNHNQYVRPIHKLCLIATRKELENVE